jgi:hypothetical protein
VNKRLVLIGAAVLLPMLGLAVGLHGLAPTMGGVAMAQGPAPQGEVGALAVMGTGFTYQGQLMQGGSPVSGTCSFQFGLWNASSGSGQVGATQTVASQVVVAGYFTTAPLDFGDGAFNGEARWLDIRVNCGSGYAELGRQPLTPAPYALALPGLWTQQKATSPNLIGGYSGNSVNSTVVGAAIGGGGSSGFTNQVTGDYGTVGGGQGNQANGVATVGGGESNQAGGLWATVGGGDGNTASANYAAVGGGQSNQVSANYAAIGGGRGNQASSSYATVGGGYLNEASNQYATVGGGYSNQASRSWATVGGGYSNKAITGSYTTVGGGAYNEASNDYATVAGGVSNKASGSRAAVGGGGSNQASGSYATIGGGAGNKVITGTSTTVGGGANNTASGAAATVGGGESNQADGSHATIGGGFHNTAGGDYATVGGGGYNQVSGYYATVGGGASNRASGDYATVAGGYSNEASGDYSFAAGRRAKANQAGCFVWGDSTGSDLACDVANAFIVRASGGVTMYTNASASTGVRVAAGGGSWSSVSDRALKANVLPVDGTDVLARLAQVPVSTWNYTTQDPSIRHMGPMAQDFSAAFGLGEDDTHISTVDADGVALAAIQGLYAENQALAAENAALRARLDGLEARLAALEAAAGGGER